MVMPYRIDGTSSERPPILTVHGLVSSRQHWCFFTPHFAREREVISWDYRGHGGHPCEDPRVGVETFAGDAFEVWRAARRPPAVVVGLSFGVQVALEIWRRHPEMVAALVLICGTPGHPLDRISSSPALRRRMASTFRALGRRRLLAAPLLAFARSAAGVTIARELTYASGGAKRGACPRVVLDDLFVHVGSLAPELIGNVIGAYLEHTAEDVLPTITAPALVIAGDRDELTPVETAERMARAIPGSELVVFPGHSHLVQVEIPEQVHAAIDDFLRAHRL
jgi:pimeloyl-ACP methyl ester carboxylesterase